MDTELISRMLTANNLALSLDAIRRHDYPLAFHLIQATYGSFMGRELKGYYYGMDESEARLLRAAVNGAWQQELSQLTNPMIKRMKAEGQPLSTLSAYLSQSGLPWVWPLMSSYDLLSAMMATNDRNGVWSYLMPGRRGVQQIQPYEIREDPNDFIAKFTARSQPVLRWSTQVTLTPVSTCGVLFSEATVQATFGRRSRITPRKTSILFEHVNLRLSVWGYGPDEQPTGKSLLDRSVEMWFNTDEISISR